MAPFGTNQKPELVAIKGTVQDPSRSFSPGKITDGDSRGGYMSRAEAFAAGSAERGRKQRVARMGESPCTLMNQDLKRNSNELHSPYQEPVMGIPAHSIGKIQVKKKNVNKNVS